MDNDREGVGGLMRRLKRGWESDEGGWKTLILLMLAAAWFYIWWPK
jgi:hypothetical protein